MSKSKLVLIISLIVLSVVISDTFSGRILFDKLVSPECISAWEPYKQYNGDVYWIGRGFPITAFEFYNNTVCQGNDIPPKHLYKFAINILIWSVFWFAISKYIPKKIYETKILTLLLSTLAILAGLIKYILIALTYD